MLHISACCGLGNIVKALLKVGAGVIAIDHKYQETSLHRVANHTSDLLARDEGVDFMYKSVRTPLHWAAKNGHKNIVETLLKNGANVNNIDIDEKTPLHWAAKNNHVKVVKVLLKNGANPSLKDKDDYIPEDLARDNNIKRLLEKAEKNDS